ncbi:unnamed protein product [Cochlearia groenlandica]
MALKTIFVVSMLLLAIYLQTALGHEVKCENLDKDTCAFAVSSTGKRCVLEKSVKRSGFEVYTCRSSEIETNKVTNMIESEECIKSCGLDRTSFGISSDALLESRFTQKLCSVQCLNQCPNVVDLFFNLAAGEGVYLPKLCDSQDGKPRRAMSEIRSSGIAMDILGPVGPVRLSDMAQEPATSTGPMPYAPPPYAPAPSTDFIPYAPAPSISSMLYARTPSMGPMPYAPAPSMGPMPYAPAPSMGPMPYVPTPSIDPMPYVLAPSMGPMPYVLAPSLGPTPYAPAPSSY